MTQPRSPMPVFLTLVALAFCASASDVLAAQIRSPEKRRQGQSFTRAERMRVHGVLERIAAPDGTVRSAARKELRELGEAGFALFRRFVHADAEEPRADVLRRLIGLARVRARFRAKLVHQKAGKVWQAKWWRDGRIALLPDYAKPAAFVDAKLHALEDTIGEEAFSYLAISHDARATAWSANGQIWLRTWPRERPLSEERQSGAGAKAAPARLRKHPSQRYASVVFDQESKSFAVGVYGRKLRVFAIEDLAMQAEYAISESASEGALTPVFTPDGKSIIVGNRNGATEVFDRASGARTHKIAKQMTHQILVTPDSARVLLAYVDGSVQIYNLRTSRVERRWRTSCEDLFQLAMSRDGELLATAGYKGAIEIWSLRYGGRVAELPTPSERVFCLDFDASGKRLLEAGKERLAIWQIDVVRR